MEKYYYIFTIISIYFFFLLFNHNLNIYKNYDKNNKKLPKHPYFIFKDWYDLANYNKIYFSLATSINNIPNNRTITLQEHSKDGFFFSSHKESGIYNEIKKNNIVSANFILDKYSKSIKLSCKIQIINDKDSNQKNLDTYNSIIHKLIIKNLPINIVKNYIKNNNVDSINNIYVIYKLIPYKYEFIYQDKKAKNNFRIIYSYILDKWTISSKKNIYGFYYEKN
jgi:pyridoxine/pyridoxamine 5'-phosphate oxidase